MPAFSSNCKAIFRLRPSHFNALQPINNACFPFVLVREANRLNTRCIVQLTGRAAAILRERRIDQEIEAPAILRSVRKLQRAAPEVQLRTVYHTRHSQVAEEHFALGVVSIASKSYCGLARRKSLKH